MSYGFQIENPNGFLAVTSDFITPYFHGKAAFLYSMLGQPFDGGTMRVSTWTFTTTAPADCLPLITLPDIGADVRYSAPGISVVNGQVQIGVQAVHLFSVTPSPPEVYVFRYGAVPSSGEAWGIQLLSATGQVTFDSGQRHFMPYGVFARPAAGASVSLTGMPAKPLFLLPTYIVDQRSSFSYSEQDGSITEGTFYTTSASYFTRRGSSLRFDLLSGTSWTSYGNMEDLYTTWGTASDGGIVMLNAATYD